MCAGPYSQNLLGIDNNLALKYEQILLEPRYASVHTCLLKII